MSKVTKQEKKFKYAIIFSIALHIMLIIFLIKSSFIETINPIGNGSNIDAVMVDIRDIRDIIEQHKHQQNKIKYSERPGQKQEKLQKNHSTEKPWLQKINIEKERLQTQEKAEQRASEQKKSQAVEKAAAEAQKKAAAEAQKKAAAEAQKKAAAEAQKKAAAEAQKKAAAEAQKKAAAEAQKKAAAEAQKKAAAEAQKKAAAEAQKKAAAEAQKKAAAEAQKKAAAEAQKKAAAEAQKKAAAEAQKKAAAEAQKKAAAEAQKKAAAKSSDVDDFLSDLTSEKNAPKLDKIVSRMAAATEQIKQKKSGASRVEIDSYLSEVKWAIQSKFYDADTFAGKTCDIRIRLALDGFLISATPESGDQLLCLAAINAARTAKIPKPPSQDIWDIVKETTVEFKP